MQISTLLSIKTGGQVGSRVFLGCVFDLGYYQLGLDDDVTPMRGVVLFPRFQVDVMTVRAGGFKWALFAALGTEVVPHASTGMQDLGGGERFDLSQWSIRPMLMVGTSFGG